MRILIQRVKRASVTISGKIKSKIDTGLLILVGIEEADTKEDAEWLAKKATSLRIFDDENGIMNRSVKDIGGSVLIVSQFTLHASTKKGNRPSYIKAAKHEHAIPMYEALCHYTEQEIGKSVAIEEAQITVDQWIKEFGVKYFSELTNMAILTEEVGEVARIISRRYGDQSFKESDKERDLGDEMADVLWVLLCLANQTGINLTEAFEKNLLKKTNRDKERHINNPKLY